MNRTSFLNCQPFLYPLSLSSVLDDSGRLSQGYRHEVLLDGNLSIEPCENSDFERGANSTKNNVEGQYIGPAYFLAENQMTAAKTITREGGTGPNEAKQRGINSEDDDKESCAGNDTADPTFCNVQLTLHIAKLPPKGMTTPIKKADRRNVSEIEDQDVPNDEVILVANIDGNHFQVDLSRIHNISIGQSDEGRHLFCGENTNEISKKTVTKKVSSCLIIEFPSCCFRFFSSTAPALSTSDENDAIGNMISSQGTDRDRKKFDSVRLRMEKILSSDYILPFPLCFNGLMASSGQKLEPMDAHKHGDPLVHSRRCLQSYSKSWKDLMLFDDTLENPYSGLAEGSLGEKEFKDTVNNLMEKIPEQLSRSFMEEDKWTEAIESCENMIAAKMREFDDVIDHFWNHTSDYGSSNKRRKKNDEKCQSQHDCITCFDDILRDHKKFTISKHELYLLPIRG